jgi:hypothetical protein
MHLDELDGAVHEDSGGCVACLVDRSAQRASILAPGMPAICGLA